MRLILLALAALIASAAPAATVKLSNGANCPYSAITVDASGNLVVSCAGVVTPVVPGGGPVPPVIVTPPPVIVPPPAPADPCADILPSLRPYMAACRAPAVGPSAPNSSPQPAGNADFELVRPGAHPIFRAGNRIVNMPDVRAGETIEVSVSAGFGDGLSGVTVTIRDPLGNVIKNSRNGLGPELFEGGYGIITFVAPMSGNYTVETRGGGDSTTLNHWR